MISLLLTFLFDYIPKIPKFIVLKIIDIYNYFRYKEWKNFNMFGMYIYIGMFGTGKTISMVNKAYKIAKRYPDVKILTNFQLTGFPEHTTVIPLTNYQQIIDIDGNTLILLDEISSIFNSRNWKNAGVPSDLIGLLLQVRKERKVIFGTAQRFKQVDALIRQITFRVVRCNTLFGRWTFNKEYDALDYDLTQDTYNYLPQCLGRSSFLQTRKIRNLYDTYEMIDKAKKTEFLTDTEILEKQGTSIVQNSETTKTGILKSLKPTKTK